MTMEGKSNSVSYSISLETIGIITFIVFISLKCSGAWASLPWFWVWFPLWFPIASTASIVLVWIVVCLIMGLLSLIHHKKEGKQ